MANSSEHTFHLIKINAFIGQLATELGATVRAGMSVIGQRRGQYQAFALRPAAYPGLTPKSGTSSLFPSSDMSNLGKEAEMPKYTIEHIHRIGDRSLNREDLIKQNAKGQFFVRLGTPFWQRKRAFTRSPNLDMGLRRTKTPLRVAVCVNIIAPESKAAAIPSAVSNSNLLH